MTLKTELTFIKGVGQRRADVLRQEIGLARVEDLLYYFPYKYVDRSRFYRVAELVENMPFVQLCGEIVGGEMVGEGKARRFVAQFVDGSGTMELVWFKGIRFVQGRFRVGKKYVVFGKPARFGSKFSIAHPEVEEATEANLKKLQGFQAFYNTTEKMKNNALTSNVLWKIVWEALSGLEESVAECLPDWILEKYALVGRGQALRQIHFPSSAEELAKAKARLKFEELFYIQLSILRQSKFREQKFEGFVFSRIGENFNDFYNKYLPFALTGAQKKVLREIRRDMNTGRQMNRLLQGDVGSGKTIVALFTALMALDNGFQACIMAPTEILATQHFQSISSLLKNMNIRVGLLTGSVKKSVREPLHEALKSGEMNLIIGTHALLEDTVEFRNLGLVVIDEQHRFGVAQRARLWGKNICPPHVLVMTATPIPRTLAMTLYGDLEVSVLDELPPGRKPIQTFHYFDNKRDALNGFLKKQIDLGRQVYIVYPLIQESEKMDLKNLETGYEYIKTHFPAQKVSMVHGKMKPAEKDAEMQKFLNAETQIMVATTVIEVGVNVPNASVMVIENAERFGLSQLHQLRGRVGRGAEQSYCILMTKFQISSTTRQRLETMVRTNNGFEIAEADLQLRGPGDIDGTQQSGLPFDLKIASLSTDGAMLSLVRGVAQEILEQDPLLEKPENLIFIERLKELQKDKMEWNWSVIS